MLQHYQVGGLRKEFFFFKLEEASYVRSVTYNVNPLMVLIFSLYNIVILLACLYINCSVLAPTPDPVYSVFSSSPDHWDWITLTVRIIHT